MKKDLHLRPRSEGTRDAISVPTMFDLAEIKAHFDDSLTSIEKQTQLCSFASEICEFSANLKNK